MIITIETDSYNRRRFSKPWIAKVDFEKSVQGEFAWGDWTGDQYNGGEGTLSINAVPGEIIAHGQKDHRQPKNSAPEFEIVGENGEFRSIGDKGAAYKYFLETKKTEPINPLAGYTDVEIIAEMTRRGLSI